MASSEIKAELEGQLAALQTRLTGIKKDAAHEYPGDSAEQAQERENDEVVDAIGNETANSIAAVKAALERFKGGSYGICGSCGEQIGKSRLKAIPEAIHCFDCSDQAGRPA
ncbi:MAG: DnaK suppressor protein [Halioglobus sp.]|jgi:DnaK suppressor protein